jgi:hypothetical protein
MANIKAAQSGNWSSTATWQGGVLPGPEDIAIANGFTVTIDQDIDVQRLVNSTFGTSTVGGFFQITTVGAGVTRNVFVTFGLGNFGGTFVGATGGLLRISATSGTVNFGSTNIGSGGSSNFTGLLISGSGITINCTGDVRSFAFNVIAIQITGSCTATFNNVFAGTSSSAPGISINAPANVTVNEVFGSNASPAITVNTSGATLSALGKVVSRSSGTSFFSQNAISIFAANCNITCFSSLITNGASPAIGVSSNSTFLGNYTLYGPFFSSIESNTFPVYLPDWKVPAGNTVKIYIYDSEKNLIELSSQAEGPYPNESDVLVGVEYNDTSGTLDLPPESSVAYGVRVGGSAGSAFITEEDIVSAEVSSGVSLSEKMLNSATISSSGNQIAAALTSYIGGA